MVVKHISIKTLPIMKTLKLCLLTLCFLGTMTIIHGQTADEIIHNFIENTGGKTAWSQIKSMKVTGTAKQGGVDYPFVATYMNDGRYVIDVNIQGASFIVEAFDGEQSWAMNFQTQKAEAADSETSFNVKNEAKDEITGPFYNYKNKGYQVELLGKDTWEGTETFKIKLTKKPSLVDGAEVENTEIYFFDTENFVPLAVASVINSGPDKGATVQTVFSDYQEVDGLYMAFSQINKFNGQIGLEMHIKQVAFNTEIDETIFTMPE